MTKALKEVASNAQVTAELNGGPMEFSVGIIVNGVLGTILGRVYPDRAYGKRKYLYLQTFGAIGTVPVNQRRFQIDSLEKQPDLMTQDEHDKLILTTLTGYISPTNLGLFKLKRS